MFLRDKTPKPSLERVAYWRSLLNLQKHPEGGSFARAYTGPDNNSSAIYYLLNGKEFSAFHRLDRDELWHFYDGSPLLIHMIKTDGEYSWIRLGTNFEEDEAPMGIVPAGCYFGAEVIDKSSFTLVGCTLAPAFDFTGFVMPGRAELLALFPQHEPIITRLTRD